MILIASVCLDKLSELEFVRPVENILKQSNIEFCTEHYARIAQDDIDEAEKVVICGTALKDFAYFENVDKFGWLREFEKPVLGICAGFQIIGKIFGNEIVENTRIGQFKVDVLQKTRLTSKMELHSYFLNSNAVNIEKPFVVVAKSGQLTCMIKHKSKEIYGCLFHPEVLNPEIIVNFCGMSAGS